ncbi:MAG: hypothetical protein M3N52_11570 [Actinomycetota bacterium]|nr:hypothetical protein [Actinomycetota bacterium]
MKPGAPTGIVHLDAVAADHANASRASLGYRQPLPTTAPAAGQPRRRPDDDGVAGVNLLAPGQTAPSAPDVA